MCHLYPYKNVKLLWKLFYINLILVGQEMGVTWREDCTANNR